LVFFHRVVSVCFGLFRNSLFRLFRFYTETERFEVSIEPKQTEDQAKQFDREHILVFLGKFRVVSVCLGLFRNSSVYFLFFYFSCFDISSKHRNKLKSFVFGFTKQAETDLVPVCFGLNQNFLLFVSRTP
jgi:hypothetical protein